MHAIRVVRKLAFCYSAQHPVFQVCHDPLPPLNPDGARQAPYL